MAEAQRHNPGNASELAAQLGVSARRLKFQLAKNVSAARQRAGLTQRELADLAELSRATVNLVEAGICDPRLSTITRLAHALQVDTMALLTDGVETAGRSIDLSAAGEVQKEPGDAGSASAQ